MALAWFFRSLEQGAWEAAEQHPRLAIPVTLSFACEELGSVAGPWLCWRGAPREPHDRPQEGGLGLAEVLALMEQPS